MTVLYKYLADPGIIPHVVRGQLKFTPIAELNDPSELCPTFAADDVQSSLERLRSVGYTDDDLVQLRAQGALLQRLAPHHQAVPVPSTREEANALVRASFYDSLETLSRLLEHTAEEMASRVGLFCLSRRYDCLPMWAHYAANASGAVVEFRGLEDVFPGDDTGVLNCPIDVRYDREGTGVTFDPSSHMSIFFSKFRDWSYEQEVRIVRPLVDCERRQVSGKPLHLFRLPGTRITRVILGWNMSADWAATTRRSVSTADERVSVVQARFERGLIHLMEPAVGGPAEDLRS